jgi:hypothetical protein
MRQMTIIDQTGALTVLVELLTYLCFCWHLEYTMCEQYRVNVCIFSFELNSTSVLDTAYGVEVIVDMAVHDAAFACLIRLHGEYRELDDSPFRYIMIASSEGERGYYASLYSSTSHESFAT